MASLGGREGKGWGERAGGGGTGGSGGVTRLPAVQLAHGLNGQKAVYPGS